MKFRLNLKHQYPLFILVGLFGATVILSFKHESAPESNATSTEAASTATFDQIQLSAMHAEPAPSVGPATVSARDLAQAKILDEILVSKNDNDPRLDTDLKGLSPAAKDLLRTKYASLTPEKRNERGTIVFLVGRELSSAEDFQFLHQVLSEAPCRSLASCDREETGAVAPADRHFEGTHETTLAYPQIVALKSIEVFLSSPSRPTELEASALAELEAARRSPIRKVAALAEEIAARRAAASAAGH